MTHRTFTAAVFAALVVASPAAAEPAFYVYSAPVVTNSATLAMTAGAVIPGAHASVWLGVSDLTGKMTLQAGVVLYQDELCVYVEKIDVSGRVFRCLRPTELGEPVQVQLTFSKRHGTVLWVDGKPVESATFKVLRIATDSLGHSKPYVFAIAETYGPATVTPSIIPG